MAKATGFQIDLETMDIKMNAGDTGSYIVHGERESGTEWTADDRMLYTVRNAQKEIVLQRFYRLDDAFGLGDGWVLIEFHNDDTDDWEPGTYDIELRYDVNPVWTGTPPTGRCEDALRANAKIVEGSIVRTTTHATLTVEEVYGTI